MGSAAPSYRPMMQGAPTFAPAMGMGAYGYGAMAPPAAASAATNPFAMAPPSSSMAYGAAPAWSVPAAASTNPFATAPAAASPRPPAGGSVMNNNNPWGL